MALQYIFLIPFTFLVVQVAEFKPLVEPQDPNNPIRNHSILFYEKNSRAFACTYCTDEYYSSDTTYVDQDCYNQYLKVENNITSVENVTYHRLCKSFEKVATYKKDVQCPALSNIDNGTTVLQNNYYTFDNIPSAFIDEPIVGTQLMIYCDPGYIAENDVAKCSVIHNKPVWNPSPKCTRIGCFGMPDPKKGKSSCNVNIVENGTICNVTCESGSTPSHEYSQCINGNYTVPVLTCQTPVKPPTVNTGAIIGGTIGGIVCIIVFAVVFICKRYCEWKKLKKRNKNENKPPPNGVGLGHGNQEGQQNGRANGHINRDSQVNFDGTNATVIRSQPVDPDSIARNQGRPDTIVDVPSGPEGPPSSNIGPETSPSSLDTDSTRSTNLTPASPPIVLSPADDLVDESSPLIDVHQPHFPQNDSITRPVEASYDSEPKFPSLSSFDVGSNTLHHSSNLSLDHKSESTSADIKATEEKTPVEDEYFDVEDFETDKSKQPVENEDSSIFPSLNSTGSDLINMAAGGDATNPKTIVENENTNPKVLSELPEEHADRSEKSVETLDSNPRVSDLGITRTASDGPYIPVRALGATATSELQRNQSDLAYGSTESTLTLNPEPLLKDEEEEQDTGRGTMVGNLDDSIED